MDILAQAEHDPNARAMLVTTSMELANSVVDEMNNHMRNLSASDTIKLSLANGTIVLVQSIMDAVNVANRKAPEHLELQVRNPNGIVNLLSNYGSLFVGKYVAEVLGDYCGYLFHHS